MIINNIERGFKKMETTTQEDLSLKNLYHYTGTEQYHKISLFDFANLTDGIMYIMQNGYTCFVTDFLSLIATNHENLRKQEFLSISLEVNKSLSCAVMRVTDGNERTLYLQQYGYTNAKTDLKLFYTDQVLMLSGEY